MDAHGAFSRPRLSPDGKRLAPDIEGSNDQVWLYDVARHTLTPLTFAWDNQVVTWTPDGKRIVFISDRAGYYNFYSQLPDDSGSVERLTERP